MAKKKTEDVAPVEESQDVMAGEKMEENVDSNTSEATPTQSEDIPEVPVEAKKPRASKKTSEGKTATAQSEDIPEDVKAILKCFPNEEELYVSKYGGTFPKDSEPFVRGNAILYKNPFYKS